MICDFCGTKIKKGTGKIYVKNDGKTLEFCSTKCEKNLLKLKRNPRKFHWTKAGRIEKEKRILAMKKKEVGPKATETDTKQEKGIDKK